MPGIFWQAPILSTTCLNRTDILKETDVKNICLSVLGGLNGSSFFIVTVLNVFSWTANRRTKCTASAKPGGHRFESGRPSPGVLMPPYCVGFLHI